jgi:hypothetical protein
MYVLVNVVIPNRIDRKQKEIVEALAKTSLDNHDAFNKYYKNLKKNS